MSLACGWLPRTWGKYIVTGKIAHNLKAPESQILDDLNGVLSPLQRRVMKELLAHPDELNEHIRNLNDEIDRFMKPEERQAAEKIQDVPDIAQTSAQAVTAVIGTDMSRFPTDKHISSWAGLCPGNNEILHILFTATWDAQRHFGRKFRSSL